MPDRPGPGPREAGGRVGAIVAWAVIAAACAAIVVGQIQSRRSASAEPAPAALNAAPEPGGMLEFQGKYALFAVHASPATDAQRRTLVGALTWMVETPTDRVRAAIVAGELVGAAEALRRLDEIDAALPAPPAEDPAGDARRRDIETLRRIYTEGPGAVEPARAAELTERHGWFGRLALAFGVAPGESPKRELIAEAQGVAVALFGFAAALGVLGIAGIGLFIVAVVLVGTRRLRWRYRPPARGGSACAEAFAVFLVGFLAISLLGDLAPRAPAWLSPVLSFAGEWGIWLLLLAPAWPIVRGTPWREVCRNVGWTRGRGVGREVAAGVVGYIACLPILALGVGLTLLLFTLSGIVLGGERPAPPSHPLPRMLAAGGWWTIVRLVLLAAVWAPLVEESNFRGSLYHHLRGWMGPVLAGVCSGFLFAVIHPQGILGVPAVMAIGVNLALLREWRGSLIASMTGHALNNASVVALLLVLFSA